MIVKHMLNQSPALDAVFHALADPARRAMLQRLGAGPASVSDLAAPFAMSLPAVLLHLKVLETGGLIRSEKHGRVRTCHLNRAALAGAELWFSQQRAAWERRLDRLGDLLAEPAPPQGDDA